MLAPGFNEDFLEFESKVHQVMKLLEDISVANKKEGEDVKKPEKDIYQDIDKNNFIVTTRENSVSVNKKKGTPLEELQRTSDSAIEMDKFTFMQQLELDANDRHKAFKERERIAQNFRALGNEAYRKANYEKAINMYTKAIDHIKDSPILYNNRALSYIKLKNFKRAIMDCDYVLNKLEEKNLRSWLYRSAAYKRLGDENNFENSIKLARKNNPKKGATIDEFLDKLKLEGI
uniref:TPR_REGION domain-containing protein n=1 Tax=Glossina brevipalpis TaxID=37001 RepID=A0A1A9X1N9_9MUSC